MDRKKDVENNACSVHNLESPQDSSHSLKDMPNQ